MAKCAECGQEHPDEHPRKWYALLGFGQFCKLACMVEYTKQRKNKVPRDTQWVRWR